MGVRRGQAVAASVAACHDLRRAGQGFARVPGPVIADGQVSLISTWFAFLAYLAGDVCRSRRVASSRIRPEGDSYGAGGLGSAARPRVRSCSRPGGGHALSDSDACSVSDLERR